MTTGCLHEWPLLPWGCIVQVFFPKHLRSWKFGEHAIPAIYLGCCEGIKEGILVYVFLTKKVRIAREYIILPKIFRVTTGRSTPLGETKRQHLPFKR